MQLEGKEIVCFRIIKNIYITQLLRKVDVRYYVLPRC